jgi:hypothetical protein
MQVDFSCIDSSSSGCDEGRNCVVTAQMCYLVEEHLGDMAFNLRYN